MVWMMASSYESADGSDDDGIVRVWIKLEFFGNYCILQQFQCISSVAAVALTVSDLNRWISKLARPQQILLEDGLKNHRTRKVQGGRISDHTIGGGEVQQG